MKKLEKENILEFQVEDFAHLIINKTFSVESLKKKVQDLNLSEENFKIIFQRIDFAEERINKPLSWSETILFVLIPFGRFNRFTKTNFIQLDEELRLGYSTRVKEFYLYSYLGIAFYFVLVLLFIFIR